ncbi:MAG: glycine C-acetyltransferase [Phycisphaerae bacterium]|jgi:glycine C-acetyltransferase
MYKSLKQYISEQLEHLRSSGLYKNERIIVTPQSSRIKTADGRELLNFCANNYLGLANDPRIIAAAKASYDQWGFGLSSVRFICGTQQLHKQLESRLSQFLGTEDSILYSSCFDANGGLFETILGEQDAVISDELNHASIIDGIRLCKAKRLRYKSRNMKELESVLLETRDSRIRLIATDGVFSMDGTIAPLADICDLADKYDAVVMVDDSHAVGFMGSTGRGTHEYHGVMDRVDILTGTFGKALGGASGGYISGRKEIIELLRQRSRPYLFSNTLAPAVVSAAITALDILSQTTELRDRLESNTKYFRVGMADHGFDIPQSDHPIVPIMLGDAVVAAKMATMLFEKGIYVVAFSYPVVPIGKARIRVQISAAHTREDLDFAIKEFELAFKANARRPDRNN